MGMYGAVWQIAAETISDLSKDPSLIKEIIEELEEYNEELEESEKVFLDLDKSWDMLSYLLKKKFPAPQFGFLTSFGHVVGDTDLGYGPGRIIQPEEVKIILQKLKNVQFDDLHTSVSMDDLISQTYSAGSEGVSSEESVLYLQEHFERLKHFLTETEKYKRGLLVYIY